MGDVLQRRWVVTLDEFHAFRDERPKEEKWELIDGVMTMMPPPALTHQRISKNLMIMLNAALAASQPGWEADFEIGLLLPKDDRYNPEPDVVVIDRDYVPGQIYAERFYFVAEVRSPNDKPVILDLKRAYYQAHEPCLGVLFVDQERIAATLMLRTPEGWASHELTAPTDAIVIPGIGDIGTLGQLYRSTPLAPR